MHGTFSGLVVMRVAVIVIPYLMDGPSGLICYFPPILSSSELSFHLATFQVDFDCVSRRLHIGLVWRVSTPERRIRRASHGCVAQPINTRPIRKPESSNLQEYH